MIVFFRHFQTLTNVTFSGNLQYSLFFTGWGKLFLPVIHLSAETRKDIRLSDKNCTILKNAGRG